MKPDEGPWVDIPNWDKFQHYKDRTPPWIKLYLELNRKPEWLNLTLPERGLLCTCWIEFAATRGPVSVKKLQLLCQTRQRGTRLLRQLMSLSDAGFIELVASNPSRTRTRKEEKRREEGDRASTQRGKPTPEPRAQAGAYRPPETIDYGNLEVDQMALIAAKNWLADHQ